MSDERGRYRRPKISVVSLFSISLLITGSYIYYYNVFKWRSLGAHSPRLIMVSAQSNPDLVEFCRETVKIVTTPIHAELDKVRQLRASARQASFLPTGFNQEIDAIRGRLEVINSEALVKRVPKRFEKKYLFSLNAIQSLNKSLDDLEQTFAPQGPARRNVSYKNSVEHYKSAYHANTIAHHYFVERVNRSNTVTERR